MSVVAFRGADIVWGFKPEWLDYPINGLPPGAKVRLRFRSKTVGQAFVRKGGILTQYLLRFDGPFAFKLFCPMGANQRKNQRNNQRRDASATSATSATT
jgi:hypothetical protein